MKWEDAGRTPFRQRLAPLLIGFMLGLGFPFLVASVVLMATNSVMRIEVVRR